MEIKHFDLETEESVEGYLDPNRPMYNGCPQPIFTREQAEKAIDFFNRNGHGRYNFHFDGDDIVIDNPEDEFDLGEDTRFKPIEVEGVKMYEFDRIGWMWSITNELPEELCQKLR